MFPKSSIKRLRFAFAAMAGLTILALIVGCITFALSHAAQKQFLGKTAPLLVNIERLSKAAVGFSSTSRELETITTQRHLDSVLARYRTQSDLLKTALLDLAEDDFNAKIVRDLNDVLREMGEHKVLFGEALSTNIKARKRLAALRREIKVEGQRLLDQLSPLALETSLKMMDYVQGLNGHDIPDPNSLAETLNEVQLLTDISFSTERFLQIVGQDDLDDPSSLSSASLKSLKSAFRNLTQLVLKLRDENKRQTIAASLRLFNEKWQETGGVTDQYQYLSNAVALLDALSQQRVLLLTRMTELMDRIVNDARARFFNDAETAQRRSLIAIVALALFSTIAFATVIWIGWRLINRDIAERLDRLATSTVALASGDLDIAIDQTGSDELTDMARATEIFRQNALELRQAEAELADRLIEAERTNEKLGLVNARLDSTNAELASHTRELERSNQELDDFAYIASHDLKEPLRAMYNHASFVLEDCQGKLDEDSEKRLNRMIKLSRRMEQLIADLLYFSRLGRGNQVMETIDLNSVIADIEANLAETLKSRNARIWLPEHLLSISGHPAHMTALFQNLISNGIKYNDAEDKVVEIGLIPAAQDKGVEPFETIYIRDNGIGIEEQFQDDVFRIFKRLNSEKAYGEGTGAGLTFVKKIVENHGGRVWFDSKIGEGTTFFFTLRRESSSSASEADHHAA